MTPRETLIAARARIASPECWCQKWLAVDDLGQSCDPRRSHAVRFCALGALDSTGAVIYPAETYLYAAAQALYGMSVTDVNDTLDHAAVLAMYDQAIELAQSGEVNP